MYNFLRNYQKLGFYTSQNTATVMLILVGIYIAMNTNFLFIYSGSWHKCQKNPSRQAQLQIASHIAPEKDN